MKIRNWRDKKGKFSSFKAAVKKFFVGVAYTAVGVTLLFIAFTTGAATFSTSKVEAIYTPVAMSSAVLSRIADCESGNGKVGSATQFAPSGQVQMHWNANGTVDVGKYGVNTVWFKKATELGLDLTKEADNQKMAEWIYLNRGTGDWYSSAHCWQK